MVKHFCTVDGARVPYVVLMLKVAEGLQYFELLRYVFARGCKTQWADH